MPILPQLSVPLTLEPASGKEWREHYAWLDVRYAQFSVIIGAAQRFRDLGAPSRRDPGVPAGVAEELLADIEPYRDWLNIHAPPGCVSEVLDHALAMVDAGDAAAERLLEAGMNRYAVETRALAAVEDGRDAYRRLRHASRRCE